MNILAIFKKVESLGGSFKADGERIVVDVSTGALTDEEWVSLKIEKLTILKILQLQYLIRSVVDAYGGEEESVLTAYINDVINQSSDKLDEAIACFSLLFNEINKENLK